MDNASCLFCDLARRGYQGVRLSTPRESVTWTGWRSRLQEALRGAVAPPRRGAGLILPSSPRARLRQSGMFVAMAR